MPRFRVAIVGISIEILLRSPLRTTGSALQVIRGDELDRDVWMIRGAIRRLRLESDFEVRPLIWGTALPGGAVDAEAYAAFKSETLNLLKGEGPFDGVVAVNHGALEIEGLNLSGDSDFLMAVRQTVGESVPIAVALDLHGNFTSQMLAACTVFSVLRTAPHRDDDETGYRAADQLVRTLRRELRPFTAAVRVPILAPGEVAVTTQPPGRELYGQLSEIDREPGVVEANLMIGFAWNDRPWSGMTALATASDGADTALKWALALARRAWDRRGDFRLEMETADIQPGIARAIAADDGPVYLSDSGDNTTAGAPGDLTIVLQAALDAPGIADALVLGILAPETVRRAQGAGVGASIEVELGAEHISLVAPKRRAAAIVEAFDDALRLEGFQPYGLSQGGWARLRFGPVVATFHELPVGVTTPAHMTAMGVDPISHKLYVVKLGYLHPQLEDIAKRHILLLSPGSTDLDIRKLSWSALPRPFYPLDPDMSWSEQSAEYWISPRR